jgi:Lon-like ATP-dependent protease
LKVLEDRRVFLESAYYSSEDSTIPPHIHDIFQNGLPADFRLVGATTRSPEEIPPAIRSRCLEIFFKPLNEQEIAQIVRRAAQKLNMEMPEEAVEEIAKYATNGREAVNIVQIAGGLALTERRHAIRLEDVQWVIQFSQLSPRPPRRIPPQPQVGVVNGLAVYGPSLGAVLEIEASAQPADTFSVTVTGLVEEETIGGRDRSIRRKSMARCSIDNVLTALRRTCGLDLSHTALHVNFPGGMPVDGPSAGIAIATAIYSAVKGVPVLNTVAMTGEISIRGLVRPVGGVTAKIEAAREAGAKVVIIPRENWQETFRTDLDVKIVPVERFEDVLRFALVGGVSGEPPMYDAPAILPAGSAMGSVFPSAQ